MERAPRPRRRDFLSWRTETTRWADDDVYGHMNNAVYFELIDTAVNAHLLAATCVDIRRLPAIGVVAEVSCRYFAEMSFPAPVETGLVVERLGRSSVVYRVGLFQRGTGLPDDEASAEGRFVHVYVDNSRDSPGFDPGRETVGSGSRTVVPVPEVVRRAVEPLLAAPR